MRCTLITAVIAGLATAAMIADASAAGRKGTIYAPRGTYQTEAGTNCGGGTCSHTHTTTGPYGETLSRSGSVTRTGPGQFSSSGSVTGPYGGTVNHSGETTCANGICTHTGVVGQ